MWKTLTGLIAEQLYEHLENQNLIGEEQKGCRRGGRGTKEHLILDKVILRDCRARKTNLAMCWIDYQKAYDMLPHSWILETLKMMGTAGNIVGLLEKSMDMWNTKLEYMGEKVATVRIRRGIFQGDSLSPLLFIVAIIPLSCILRNTGAGYKMKSGKTINHMLFMDDLKLFAKNKNQLESMAQTVKIFSEDIRMKFGLEKCATLVINRGKRSRDEGVILNDGAIADLGEKCYKYLGVMKDEKIRMKEMKEKIAAEYMKRVDCILDAGLNGGNVVKGINTWAVALVRYSAGIIEWTQEELKQLDRKTRKHMTMRRMLHPRSNVDRLYLKREEGGRGLIAIEDCVRLEEAGLSDFLKWRGMDQEVYSKLRKDNSQEEQKRQICKTRTEAWKAKPLHGQFIRKIEELGITSWEWLRKGKLKKETEGMILAVQDQVLPTRNV
jgi:hypothetical protein